MTRFPHPYETEITILKYPDHVYEKLEPIQYKPLEDTNAIWVETPEMLSDMIKELSKAQEIAIDLEHHDYRSYIGIVCLMQISTRNQDWIIDTLKLREEIESLNEVFANPSIVKVRFSFHEHKDFNVGAN